MKCSRNGKFKTCATVQGTTFSRSPTDVGSTEKIDIHNRNSRKLPKSPPGKQWHSGQYVNKPTNHAEDHRMSQDRNMNNSLINARSTETTMKTPQKSHAKRSEMKVSTQKNLKSNAGRFEMKISPKTNAVRPEISPRTTDKVQLMAKRSVESRHPTYKVEGRKTRGGSYLGLVQGIRENEKEGIQYSVLNKYFRDEFKKISDRNPMGIAFVIDILTYDPRNDPAKTYTQVYAALDQLPSSIDLTEMYDIIEGLKF